MCYFRRLHYLKLLFAFYTNAKCINILILTVHSSYFVNCTSVSSFSVWFRYLLQISAVWKKSFSASFIKNNNVVRQVDLCLSIIQKLEFSFLKQINMIHCIYMHVNVIMQLYFCNQQNYIIYHKLSWLDIIVFWNNLFLNKKLR